MKRLLLLAIVLLGVSSLGISQKYAYVDTQYILDNIPEYREAQSKLDDLSKKWQEEIEEKYQLIERKRKNFQVEEILLPEEIKKEKKSNIAHLETEARELQNKYFGINGLLFQKRSEFIKPIQDKIFKAIQEISSEKKFAFVFDKANQSNLLFADPKYNISDNVLRKMDIDVKKK